MALNLITGNRPMLSTTEDSVIPPITTKQDPASSRMMPSSTTKQPLAGSTMMPTTTFQGPGTIPAPTKQAPGSMQQMITGNYRPLLSTSEDNTIMKLIEEMHAPDGREVNVKPLLNLVEEIFYRATASIDAIVIGTGMQTQAGALDETKTHQTGLINLPDFVAYNIDRISCEISCKCSGGSEAHAITISVLQHMLMSYNWDAKMVLTLAALAMKYGEFSLVSQLHTSISNPLAKSVGIIKQLPQIYEHTGMLKARFDSIKVLIKAMVDITNCILKFNDLPVQYFTTDVPAALSTARAHTPIAAYWTIRGVVACASHIAGLTSIGHEYMASTTESWELSTLAQRINNINSSLAAQLELCSKHIASKKEMDVYHELLRIFRTPHSDNMRVLRALLCGKDDQSPIVDGEKNKVNIEVLRRKYVLLLISDMDIPTEELANLDHIYGSHHTRQNISYEVVWVPILDESDPWIQTKEKQFNELQLQMRWHTIYHPSLIEKPVVKFIKEQWNFTKKPILVVIDPQGQVVSPNALHMMWIWGSKASPFTTMREEALWSQESWKIELLVTDDIDPSIRTWISDGTYICIYGGEDIVWIRDFTRAARKVAEAAGIRLEMIYVGKSNPKERVRRNTETIKEERLSKTWDLNQIWYFWVRIQSMWQSKIQLGRIIDNDLILTELMSMFSYDSSQGGWAMFGHGSAEMVKAKGVIFLTCLTQFDRWSGNVQPKGFMLAMKDHLGGLHTEHHCNQLLLPGTSAQIQERIVCSECGRTMEKYIMFKCCDE